MNIAEEGFLDKRESCINLQLLMGHKQEVL